MAMEMESIVTFSEIYEPIQPNGQLAVLPVVLWAQHFLPFPLFLLPRVSL